MTALSQFISNIVQYIIQPIIVLLFAAAMFMFVSGVVLFFDVRGADPKERERGKRLLMWGVIGFFIMTFGMSIVAAVTNTFCGSVFCTNVTSNSTPAQAPSTTIIIGSQANQQPSNQ